MSGITAGTQVFIAYLDASQCKHYLQYNPQNDTFNMSNMPCDSAAPNGSTYIFTIVNVVNSQTGEPDKSGTLDLASSAINSGGVVATGFQLWCSGFGLVKLDNNVKATGNANSNNPAQNGCAFFSLVPEQSYLSNCSVPNQSTTTMVDQYTATGTIRLYNLFDETTNAFPAPNSSGILVGTPCIQAPISAGWWIQTVKPPGTTNNNANEPNIPLTVTPQNQQFNNSSVWWTYRFWLILVIFIFIALIVAAIVSGIIKSHKH